MFNRITEIQDLVQATFGMLDNPVSILTIEEWSIIKEIKKILKSFEQVSRERNLEKHASVLMVMVIVNGLSTTLKRITKTTDKLALVFLETVQKFENFEQTWIIVRSTFLDPRFQKSFTNENAYQKVKDDIQKEMRGLFKAMDNKRDDSKIDIHNKKDINEDDI